MKVCSCGKPYCSRPWQRFQVRIYERRGGPLVHTVEHPVVAHSAAHAVWIVAQGYGFRAWWLEAEEIK